MSMGDKSEGQTGRTTAIPMTTATRTTILVSMGLDLVRTAARMARSRGRTLAMSTPTICV